MYERIIEWWKSKCIRNAADLEIALDNFRIVFACNSNGIEGNTINYHTTREIFEGKPLSDFHGTAKEIFETQNQKFAYDFLLKSFDAQKEMELAFILKLHAILLYGCYDTVRWEKGERPGKFKKEDYCVGLSDVGSLPEDVETDLQRLLKELEGHAGSKNILLKAAYFHLMFESIHPFADGNGRVGRALMNYYLLVNDYPPVVIFNEDQDAYYLSLEVFDRTEELSGFVMFLKEQMVKTWKHHVEGNRSAKKLSNLQL